MGVLSETLGSKGPLREGCSAGGLVAGEDARTSDEAGDERSLRFAIHGFSASYPTAKPDSAGILDAQFG